MSQTNPRSRGEARQTRVRRTASFEELQALVTQLVKENQQLKRELARQSAKPAGAQVDTRVLVSLTRQLEKALAPAKAARPARPARRRPVSPEVAERRRQALAKARAVRAEKRAAAQAQAGA